MHDQILKQRFYEQNRSDLGIKEPSLIDQQTRKRKYKDLTARAYHDGILLSQIEVRVSWKDQSVDFMERLRRATEMGKAYAETRLRESGIDPKTMTFYGNWTDLG